MFSKTYELSLTRNYVSAWGLEQAVRELIQNALDSDSPFVYSFETAGDSQTLFLNSENARLDPKTLLLGATSKAGVADMIGSFGEGYKLAMLVLARNGHEPEIRNGDLLWKPAFQFNSRFGEELLVIRETAAADKTNRGVTFVVRNLSQSHVDAIRASCLPMQDSIGERKQTPKGDILLDEKFKHRLFVGGLFVCETDLAYGYNVKPEFLKLERDRETVNSWDLKDLTKDMWFDTGEFDRIAKMLEEGVPDVAYAEYGSPEMVKEACYKLFREKHPGAVAVKNEAELKAVVAQACVRTVTVREGYYANITRAPSYLAQPPVRLQSPTARLEAWFNKAKYVMRDDVKASFRDLIEESRRWKHS